MEAGVPALVANKGALPEVGGEFVFYSDLVSPLVFATEMDAILKDKNAAFERAKHGREYAARKYSFLGAVSQVEKVLSLLN